MTSFSKKFAQCLDIGCDIARDSEILNSSLLEDLKKGYDRPARS